jgi:hypothetical protein
MLLQKTHRCPGRFSQQASLSGWDEFLPQSTPACGA